MKNLTILLLTLLMSIGAWSHPGNPIIYGPSLQKVCFDYNDGTEAGKLTQAIAILSEKNCDTFRFWGHYHVGDDGRPLFNEVSLNLKNPITTPKEGPQNFMSSSFAVFKEEQKGINVNFDKNFKSLKKDIEVLDSNSESIMEMSSRIEFLEDKLLFLENSLKKERELAAKNKKAETELFLKQQTEKELQKYEACFDEAKDANDLLECTKIK